MSKRLILIGILALAFCLRFIKLSQYPAGFTPDEAAQGYTAYSILKTGKDEWGVRFPLNPRSFGDFKPPVYTYLAIPSIAAFGLNEFAVRLPNALLGSLSVLVVYFLIKFLEDNFLALIASLFLAISPWHISLSRGAFEANLTSFFLPLGVLFFLKSLKSPKFFPFSTFFFGLNLLTYHSAKLVTPLILFFLLFLYKNEIKGVMRKSPRYFLLSSLIFFSFLLVVFGGLFSGAGTRASDIGIFSGGWQSVADDRFFAVKQGLPDFISRFFNNKLTFSLGEFVDIYFSYLSPHFLFTQGAGEATYGMVPGRGVLYLVELFFIIISFYFILKEKGKNLLIFWFWFLISPLPAALARGAGYHANRVAIMMPAIQIISASGAIRFFKLIKKEKKLFLPVLGFSCLCLVVSFVFFVEEYFFQFAKINASRMGYGWKKVMSYLKDEKRKIIISGDLSEPQTYVMFYKKIEPSVVQQQTNLWLEYQKNGKFVDQLGDYFLENFEFKNFSFPEDLQKKNIVLVGSRKDFIIQESSISEKLLKKEMVEKIINYPDGEVAFRMFSL